MTDRPAAARRPRDGASDRSGLARRLPEAQARSGEHSVPWDGRDDMGRALPNGAYVVQVDAGYAQERQVVLIWNR